MAMVFPTSPTVGQVFTSSGRSWVWNGTTWDSPAGSPFVAPGLVLVKSQTIGTAVSSVTVTDAFSADYDNYKITLNGGVSSQENILSLQLGGQTTAYYGSLLYATHTSSTPLAQAVNNSSSFTYAGNGNTNSQMMNVELMSPFILSRRTTISAVASRTLNTSYSGQFTGYFNGGTSFTGFTIGTNGGTMTGGTIRVYGYRK